MRRLNTKRKALMVLYALYVTFILVSTIPYLAELSLNRGEWNNGDYESHLRFPESGTYGHYTEVTLFNENLEGKIDLEYISKTNTLVIKNCENIKELTIDCKLMYKNKAQEVFKNDAFDLGSNYYKEYFKKTNDGKFSVNIDTDEPIEKLQFRNAPLPESVKVDDNEWWKTNTNYLAQGNNITITTIPSGYTTVDIYFEDVVKKNPIARFTANNYIILNEEVYLDASGSTDEDGDIISYVWDLGDNNQTSGKIVKYSYSKLGEYKVTLTVRDDDYLEDQIFKTIYVLKSSEDSDNDGVANEKDPNPFDNSDSDNDGLSDDFETVISNTNKTQKDSDGDGYDDKTEWDEGTDPNDENDHPKEITQKPDDKDESEGMFGAGTGVDVAVIVIIIIIIILILFLFLFKKRKSKGVMEVEPMKNKKDVSSGLDRVHGPKQVMSLTKDEPGIASTAIISSHTLPTSAPKPKITPRHSQTQPHPYIPTKAPMHKVTVKPVTNTGTTAPPTTESLIRKIPIRKPIVQSERSEITRDKLKVDLGPVMETYNNKKPTPEKSKPSLKPKPKIVSTFDFGEQTPAEYRYDTIMEYMNNLHIHHYKATTLYDGGFTSWVQLSEAATKDLIKVKGIGPKLADKIQRNVRIYQKKQSK